MTCFNKSKIFNKLLREKEAVLTKLAKLNAMPILPDPPMGRECFRVEIGSCSNYLLKKSK